MRYIWLSRKRGRRARASDAAVHAVPAALPASSMAKMATMALSATAKHVILMATSVVADILMLHDDDAEGVFQTQQTCVRTSQALAVHGMLDGGTQATCLSAAVK